MLSNRPLTSRITEIHNMRGFTLVELLITVAILSILVTVAVPSFNNMIERNQIVTAANDLVSALLVARSDAIKQEADIVAAKDGSWSTGWTVKDASDNIIVQHKTTHDDISITGYGNIADNITYKASGRASVSLQDTDYIEIKLGDKDRLLCLTSAGRPFVLEEGNALCP